jgi:nicotinamidase-related amidase
LHGSAPDTHHTCLLLIDVINDFEFPGGEELFAQVRQIGPNIAALKKRALAAHIPCAYANDNFGRWRSNLGDIVRHCLRPDSLGRPFVELLHPEPEDYFVLKPKHSAFYQTSLELLLKHFGTERLILTGVSSNSCVLFTAHDSHMRDLQLIVPQDCIAACSEPEHASAVHHMRCMIDADVAAARDIDLDIAEEQLSSRA